MTFRSIAIVAGVLLAATAAAFGQSVAVGTWINEAEAAGGGRDSLRLVINADGTGVFVGGGVENPLPKIEMDENSFSFTFHPKGAPPAITITMRGTAKGDTLTLQSEIRGANGATGRPVPATTLTRVD